MSCIVVLNYVGSSVLVFLIANIIVDIMHAKRLNGKGLLGRIVILIMLFIAVLRT